MLPLLSMTITLFTRTYDKSHRTLFLSLFLSHTYYPRARTHTRMDKDIGSRILEESVFSVRLA